MTIKAEKAFLRPKDVMALLGVCNMTLYNLEKKDPTFPKKIILGRKLVGWKGKDIEAWIDAKAAGGATHG